MSSAEPKMEELAHSWFSTVWNEGRADLINDLMAPDAVIHGLGDAGSEPIGRDGFRAFYQVFRGAFPDIKVVVDDVISSHDDRCAVRFHFTGTHTGDHLGMPASHKPISCIGTVFMRYSNGAIVEGWNCVDMHSLLKQIGAAG